MYSKLNIIREWAKQRPPSDNWKWHLSDGKVTLLVLGDALENGTTD